MDKLEFITDEKLAEAVLYVLNIAFSAKAKSEDDFGKNIIDPFGSLFEMSGFATDMPTWLINEKTRQAQKTLQNSLGTFHQKIIGSFNGWQDFKTGNIVDVVNENEKIVAEIKNKYNTVKGSDQKGIYDDLHNAVMHKQSKYLGFTGYCVEIIPKSSQRYNVLFTPSDKDTGQKRAENEKIRRIDGYSFYELATGVPNALNQLFLVLPDVIEECMPNIKISLEDRAFAQSFFDKAYKEK